MGLIEHLNTNHIGLWETTISRPGVRVKAPTAGTKTLQINNNNNNNNRIDRLRNGKVKLFDVNFTVAV